MTFSLPGRVLVDELMDTEQVSEEDFAKCLRTLEWINIVSFGYRPTLSWLDRVVGDRRSLTIVDVGSGHGDMLRRVWAWAEKRGIEVELYGIDLNPLSTAAARAATPPEMKITYITGDAFSWQEDKPVDVVISALFAHHLSDDALLQFFAWMDRRTELGWFVNDLHRHWFPYYGLWIVFHLLWLHRFVRHDGPVSVRRAFTRADFQAVIAASKVPTQGLETRWWFPFRWGVGRTKETR